MTKLIDRIEAFNRNRDKTFRNLKYGLMRDSQFAFMRGTCHIFYEDWPKQSSLNTTPASWIVGDLHPQNFAVYRGDDTQIYLDINDFDEAILAPCVWDVARCLTSFYLAFTKPSIENRGQAAQVYLAAYVEALQTGKPRNMQIASAPEAVQKWMKKRSQRDFDKLFNKYCNPARTKLKTIKKDHETSPLLGSAREHATALFNTWAASQPNANSFRLIDADARVGGVSSVGLERYLLLVEENAPPKKQRLFEIKQRVSSALVPYVPLKQPNWPNEAARVAALQQRLQAVASNPPYVITDQSKSYTVRELEPVQLKIQIDPFEKVSTLQELADSLGKITAWAHLRGCGRQGSASADDLIALSSKEAWQTDILKYTADYAVQITRDFKMFCKSKLVTHG